MNKIKKSRKLKNTISALTAAVTLFSGISAIADTQISEWAEEYISDAESIGMLYDISPEWTRDITRHDFCVLAYNMLDKAVHISRKQIPENVFADVDDGRVTLLYSEGIIKGRGENIFEPDAGLTREEAAVILCRIAEYMNITTAADSDIYADDDEISGWARESVRRMRALGVMKGTDIGFEPKAGYTAEQSAASLMRIYRLKGVSGSFADRLNAHIEKNKNYMFSPVSVRMALAMAANGASGETREEILNAVGIEDLDKYNSDAKEMIEKYSQSDILKLSISNSIWINKDKTPQRFSDEFTGRMTGIFGAQCGIVDDNTAGKEINGWVSEKTNERITSIIDEDNNNFWAMLVNAVYFKAGWRSEFYKKATGRDIFTDRNGKENSIDFMNNKSWFMYSEENGVKIIELPYRTRESIINENGEYMGMKTLEDMDVSMFLMMSEKTFDPEAELTAAEMSSQYTDLYVPKFKVEYSVKLNDILKDMGIKRAFTEQAELSSMFDQGNMWLTDTVHKTYINVDEEGTEAAAVTSAGGAGSSMPPEPVIVKYNRPFTFVIRDNINGEILFMGEYAFAE